MILSCSQRFHFTAALLILLVGGWQQRANAETNLDSKGIEILSAIAGEVGQETAPDFTQAEDQQLGIGMRVKVLTSTSAWSFVTHVQEVGEFLGQQGILVGPMDAVSPSVESRVKDGLVVVITRKDRDFHVEETREASGTVWRGDPELPLDEIQTRRVGNPGIKVARTRLAAIDGQNPIQDLTESRILIKPIDTVIVYGQEISKFTVNSANGQTLAYWRKTRMLATSYSASTSGTPLDAPWYGYTYSGEPMGPGVVAADLTVIPLRSRLYIPGYGIGTVLDTGGGVSGLHLDLGYEDDEYVPWYRFVDVYWLWPPPADDSKIRWVLPQTPSPN